jgi:hypothetical protein
VDRSSKASLSAFDDRGMCIAAREGRYASYNKTIVAELLDYVKF